MALSFNDVDIFYPVKNLSDVAHFLDNLRRPVKESERVAGNVPYYGANGQQGTINQHIFNEPLILLAEDGGHFNNPERGIAYKISGKSWVNNHAHVLKAKDEINHDFLFRVLQNYDVRPLITGTTRGKLTKDGASKIKIPLPPLPEQIRIAAILDKAQGVIEARKTALKIIDALKASLFIEMFGNPYLNDKNLEEVLVSDVTNSIVPGRDKPKSFSGVIKWVTTSDLNHLDYTNENKSGLGLTKEEIEGVRAKIIPLNSVLITCVGDLGICSISKSEMVINQQLHSYQCSDKIFPEYLMFALSFQKQYMLNKASSTTLPYMNKTVCNSIPILLPPLPLQASFSEKITALNTLKAKHTAHLEQLTALFSALQHKAFRGEL